MMKFIAKLILKYLKAPKQIIVPLGERNQKGSLVAVLEVSHLWKVESLNKKVRSILKGNFEPTRDNVEKLATQIFMQEVFGTSADYNEPLFRIMAWHNSQEWNFHSLTQDDATKVNGLQSMSVLCMLQFREIYSSLLNLRLAERAPQMCILLHPIVIKLPVITVRYYLDIHAEFAFNSIRKSDHPFAGDLISYFYEIQFIQYKTALSLLDVIKFSQKIHENKNSESLLTVWEVDAIKASDLVLSQLKASIEKTIAFIGFIYGIANLDSKKTHKAKIATLLAGVPERAKKQGYWEFIYEFIKSEKLDELNNYRSGLLHKKGISDLQPHNYAGISSEQIPILKIFSFLHEQHSKNTAILLGTLALLTDELIRLDPPKISIFDLPV